MPAHSIAAPRAGPSPTFAIRTPPSRCDAGWRRCPDAFAQEATWLARRDALARAPPPRRLTRLRTRSSRQRSRGVAAGTRCARGVESNPARVRSMPATSAPLPNRQNRQAATPSSDSLSFPPRLPTRTSAPIQAWTFDGRPRGGRRQRCAKVRRTGRQEARIPGRCHDLRPAARTSRGKGTGARVACTLAPALWRRPEFGRRLTAP